MCEFKFRRCEPPGDEYPGEALVIEIGRNETGLHIDSDRDTMALPQINLYRWIDPKTGDIWDSIRVREGLERTTVTIQSRPLDNIWLDSIGFKHRFDADTLKKEGD